MNSLVGNTCFPAVVDCTLAIANIIPARENSKYFPVPPPVNRIGVLHFYLIFFGRIVHTTEVENYAGFYSLTLAKKEHLKVFKTEYCDKLLKYESLSLIIPLGSVKKIPPLGWGGHCRFLVIRDLFRDGE